MLKLVGVAAAAALAVLLPAVVQAQPAYPSKPVHVIVPYPAGGSLDTVTRLIAEKLSRKWSQPVVVENRGGGSGMIGTGLAVQSPADGYTLLFTASSEVSLNVALFSTMPYDPQKDLAPVSLLVSVPVALLANGRSPVTSVQELVELAKKKPGGVAYGTPGIGTPQHFAGELLKQTAGIDMTHVPYKGAAPFITDLMGGHVQFGFLGISSVMQQINSGDIRALALASPQRSSVLPNVSTFKELGYPDVAVGQWLAVWTPAGVGENIIELLNRDIIEALSLPDVKEKIHSMGLDIIGSTPAELKKVQAQDIALYRRIAAQAGIKPE